MQDIAADEKIISGAYIPVQGRGFAHRVAALAAMLTQQIGDGGMASRQRGVEGRFSASC
jgi:hypothetical protein